MKTFTAFMFFIHYIYIYIYIYILKKKREKKRSVKFCPDFKQFIRCFPTYNHFIVQTAVNK